MAGYVVLWIVASASVAIVLVALGNALQMMPETLLGLVWRSALTGAIMVGTHALVGRLPAGTARLMFLIHGAVLMGCAFAIFGLNVAEEWVYALLFALAVGIATLGIMTILTVLGVI